MADASRDQNFVPTILAALNTTGTSTVPIKANPTSHGIAVSDGTTGTDNGVKNAIRDSNRVIAMQGVSSVDGVTPVTLYADSSGNLLIDSV